LWEGNNLKEVPLLSSMKTIIAINAGLPFFSGVKKPADLFSAEEIDCLDEEWLVGKSREELLALERRLSDTFDWLDNGDCEADSPEWTEWERRLDRLQELMDQIDESLNPDANYDEDDEKSGEEG
jgi:hypothetical protein